MGAGQLYAAVGSIQANIAEGYSRGAGRDRARFYEYGLGSVREARTWYRGALPMLPTAVLHKRFEVISQIARLLLASIPRERTRRIARREA